MELISACFTNRMEQNVNVCHTSETLQFVLQM